MAGGLTKPVRERIEALIAGEYGSTRTMTAGMFRRRSPDTDVEGNAAPMPPQDGSERLFEVAMGMPREMDPINPLDNFALYEVPVTIRVMYAHTAGGGDMPEGLTSQAGPATMDAIRDRAGLDVHQLASVLTWYANIGGLTPDLYDLHPAPGETPQLVIGPEEAVLSVPYRARINAVLPANQAP